MLFNPILLDTSSKPVLAIFIILLSKAIKETAQGQSKNADK
jgi:hypothetical protein